MLIENGLYYFEHALIESTRFIRPNTLQGIEQEKDSEAQEGLEVTGAKGGREEKA